MYKPYDSQRVPQRQAFPDTLIESYASRPWLFLPQRDSPYQCQSKYTFLRLLRSLEFRWLRTASDLSERFDVYLEPSALLSRVQLDSDQ